MTDKEVWLFLNKIDNGYNPTEKEKQELSKITRIEWRHITEIPESIICLKGLKTLVISGESSRLTFIDELNLPLPIELAVHIPRKLKQEVELKKTISRLPRTIGFITSLECLDLHSTQLIELPKSIGLLRNLQKLYLQNTKLCKLPDSIGNLKSLQELDISYTEISRLPDSIGCLHNLREFSMRSTKINNLPDTFGNLSELESLDIERTPIKELPDSIENLVNLTVLNLGFTKIRYLPVSVGNLPKLKRLNLEYTELSELPESILNLRLNFKNSVFVPHTYLTNESDYGIYILGLKLKKQPVEIFNQSQVLIEEYYKSYKKSAPINECKVVFLGDGGAGKSLIIDRLMKDGEYSPAFHGEVTPGIKISSKKYVKEDDEIELYFWDFGGQVIMHSMHRLFLTNRTLYVIVVNARNKRENEEALYWIRNIRSFAENAPIVLLVNQKDQNPFININENGLRKECPDLREIRIVSALKDTADEFNSLIRDIILQTVWEMDSVHKLFPQTWHSLIDNLQEMQSDYITSDTFYRKCKELGIDTDNSILDEIVNWFQDLGICFYSRHHPSAGRYMVLKPIWLINALYILVYNGRKYAQNGIILENDIYRLICDNSNNGIMKVWNDIKYEVGEIQYIISVLLNFELAYRIDKNRFFIPMLCDENEPEIVFDVVQEDAVHLSFEYSFLPDNVLHRLMVRHGYEIDKNILWKNGAILRRDFCGWWALIRINGNCLDIIAKSLDQVNHPINSYVDLIRESLYVINDDFGLVADEYITFYRNQKYDRFKYRVLEGYKKSGQSEIYSDVFDSMISVDEILGFIAKTDSTVHHIIDEQVAPLFSSIMNSLLRLQSNSLYFGASENQCNTFIRDLLDTSGFICKDQTLHGISETGKSEGELDILIQDKDRGINISIYEGLKMKTFTKNERKYLYRHLKKLLDNYNPQGIPNLFLISYVSWDKKSFNSLACQYSNYIKSEAPSPFTISACSLMDSYCTTFIKCIMVDYNCGGISMKVYHFIVRVAA